MISDSLAEELRTELGKAKVEIERLTSENSRQKDEIVELRALLRTIRYLPIDPDTDTLEGYAGAVRHITKHIIIIDELDTASAQQCEHGKGLTDYCEPCGRINGG